jgi:uncharacterized protein with PhoU and TrkA domain
MKVSVTVNELKRIKIILELKHVLALSMDWTYHKIVYDWLASEVADEVEKNTENKDFTVDDIKFAIGKVLAYKCMEEAHLKKEVNRLKIK